ncbi:MAG TPA: hypothetical protein VLC98_15760 [Phnomibacter sp.]|nr:hypothetical protein [Phnomibacter sp.]
MAKYIFFYLEIALRDEEGLNVYAFENISHIPTQQLVDIFKINLDKDPNILDGYFLTKSNYRKYKKYIDANMPTINLDKFEYTLRQYASDKDEEVRKLYKLKLME